MATRTPVIRRTDSLYAQLGGKATIAAVVDKFYKKVVADPDLKSSFSRANLASLKQRQVHFLTEALGGPVDSKNRETTPAHADLLRDPHQLDRAATHLAVTLSELNVSPDVVDGVMERTAAALDPATVEGTFDNGSASDDSREKDELMAQLAAIGRTHAVIELQLDGTVLNANDNFLQIMGSTLNEIKGTNYSKFVDDGTRNSPQYKAIWAKLNRGESETGEYKLLAKDGRGVWLQASYNPIPDSSGNPIKVIAFATDVTEQHKLAEEANELRVRADITNLTSIVSESDLKGDIVSINEKFIEISKYSRDELIGHPHSTTRHPDMPKEVFKELWATIGRGKTFRGVIKNRAKDGNPYYVDAVIAPVLGENGKPIKYIGVRYDITAAEIERQDMRGVIGAINETSCYAEYDTVGNVLKTNENFLKLMGYKLEEIVGKHQRMFVDPVDARSDSYARFWSDLNAGKSCNNSFKRITKAGREVWVQAVYAPIKDEMNRVGKLLEISNDITEQKAANDDLQRKVESILVTVSAASKGDLTQAVTVSGEDAIGKMGEGLSQLLTNLRASIARIGQTATTLSTSSEELNANSQQMSANAEETSAQAGVVSAASEEVSRNLQTVATSTEEMSATIKEIAKNTTESAKFASEAVKVAQATNITVSKLGDSSTEIGQVIKVITSIAQQTNLLALNATIEAARAGEAGKGFAVVANEVKELAKETAKATEDISRKIEAIQTDTKGAVDAIAAISKIINQVNDISNSIATAVEEQDATTNEMTRNVTEAAKGAGEIAKNIVGVAEAAKNTAQGAGDSQRAATQLTEMSSELRELVDQFKY